MVTPAKVKSRAARGPVNLDKGTFGGTEACHYLVDMLNAHNDHRLAGDIVSSFNHYFSGLGEIMKLDNPVRQTLLQIWFTRAQEHAVGMFTINGLDPTIVRKKLNTDDRTPTIVSLYNNVLHHRYRQASEHGMLIEKFREKDMEHGEILQALRNLAKYEKEKYAEPI